MPPLLSSYNPAADRRARRLILLGATLLIIACMALFRAVTPRAAAPVNAPAAPFTASYTAKTLSGRIAIYVAGEDRPALMTDIDVRTLPEADRAALEAGITLSGDDALARLLEDYSG